MKQTLYIIIFVFCASSYTIAQNNAVKLSLSLGMSRGETYGISFETKLNENATTELELHYLHYVMNGLDDRGYGHYIWYNGFGVTCDIKYNIFEHKINTIYLSPFYSIYKLTTYEKYSHNSYGYITEKELFGDISNFDIGVKLGYKCLILKRILLDVNMGYRVSYYNYNLLYPIFSSLPEGQPQGIISNIRPNIKIGYAF